MGEVRKLANEQLSRFLVSTNFSQSDGTRTVTMGLLDTTRGLQISISILFSMMVVGNIREQIYGQLWRRVVYEAPFHQWTCEQFARTPA